MCIFFEIPLESTGCFDRAKIITGKEYADMTNIPMFNYYICYVGF